MREFDVVKATADELEQWVSAKRREFMNEFNGYVDTCGFFVESGMHVEEDELSQNISVVLSISGELIETLKICGEEWRDAIELLRKTEKEVLKLYRRSVKALGSNQKNQIDSNDERYLLHCREKVIYKAGMLKRLLISKRKRYEYGSNSEYKTETCYIVWEIDKNKSMLNPIDGSIYFKLEEVEALLDLN